MLDGPDVNAEVGEAIRQAVKEAGQDGALATKIVAWFNALSSGNDSLADRASLQRHMELLMQHISVDVEHDQEEDDAD